MSEEKNLKKGNGEQMQQEETEESVEGYTYCSSHEQKCMNDCPPGNSFITPLN